VGNRGVFFGSVQAAWLERCSGNRLGWVCLIPVGNSGDYWLCWIGFADVERVVRGWPG